MLSTDTGSSTENHCSKDQIVEVLEGLGLGICRHPCRHLMMTNTSEFRCLALLSASARYLEPEPPRDVIEKLD